MSTLSIVKNPSLASGQETFKALMDVILAKQSLLIVGKTASGKSRLVNTLLGFLSSTENSVVLENYRELSIPKNIAVVSFATKKKDEIFNAVQYAENSQAYYLVVDEIIEAEHAKSLLEETTMPVIATIHAATPASGLRRIGLLGGADDSLTRRNGLQMFDFVAEVSRNNIQLTSVSDIVRS